MDMAGDTLATVGRTHMARMLTARVKPMTSGARPVFDLVSSATIRATVTRTKVTMHSMRIPCERRAVPHCGSQSTLSYLPDVNVISRMNDASGAIVFNVFRILSQVSGSASAHRVHSIGQCKS